MKSCTILFLIIYSLLGFSHAAEHFVVIDPGHGGARASGSIGERTLSSSNNATSPSGLKEKDLTLELSLEILKQFGELQKKYPEVKVRCLLTRTDDSNPDFAERAAVSASAGQVPALIVSIHFNASTNHDALGTVAMIAHKDRNPNFTSDHAFAQRLTRATSAEVSRFVKDSKPRPPITDAHLHGGLGSNFFFQLARYPRLQTVPKCFLEIEFMDRRDVDKHLLQNRDTTFPQIANAIASSIYEYCEQL